MILVVFSYVIFNARTIFSIGIYNLEDDFSKSYSDGTAGINLQIRLNHYQDSRYYINTYINTISTGDVNNYGIKAIDIRYLGDNQNIYIESSQFDPPLNSYTLSRMSHSFSKYENFTSYGTIELSLETGGIPKNETINFQLDQIIPYGLDDYLNIDLMLYVLFFLPFFLYVIIPIVLNLIFKPVFGLHYDEEETKRDEKYLYYLHEHIKQKRREELH